MLLKAVCVVVAASCLLPAVASAAPQLPLQPRANVRVVGPRAKVDAVVQDSRSFMWTAGDQGVCRFDGLAWACPVAQKTLAIAPDPEGGLWLPISPSKRNAGSRLPRLLPQCDRMLSSDTTTPFLFRSHVHSGSTSIRLERGIKGRGRWPNSRSAQVCSTLATALLFF